MLTIPEMERRMIELAMRKHGGKVSAVVKELGIGARTLSGKLREYGYPPRWRPDRTVPEPDADLHIITLDLVDMSQQLVRKIQAQVYVCACEDTEGRGLGKCDVCAASKVIDQALALLTSRKPVGLKCPRKRSKTASTTSTPTPTSAGPPSPQPESETPSDTSTLT